MANPITVHDQCLKRILRYLKGTLHYIMVLDFLIALSQHFFVTLMRIGLVVQQLVAQPLDSAFTLVTISFLGALKSNQQLPALVQKLNTKR